MTKDLYYTIPQYFAKRMAEHSNVDSINDESNEEFFLYRIFRGRQRDSVLVWLSDAYRFTDMDYENRPPQLVSGDYILVTKPEGGHNVSQLLIDSTRIGVGMLAELMGALTADRMWTYRPPTDEERQRRAARYRAR